MFRNPTVGQLVFVDYDNEGFESLGRVLGLHENSPGQLVHVYDVQKFQTFAVRVDFVFEVMETFAGRIMIDWRVGFGSEPVGSSPTHDEGAGRGS